MKIGIVGSRSFDDYELLKNTILSYTITDAIDCIVSGGAAGADKLAEDFADEYAINKKIYKPNYKKHGRFAAHERNTEIIMDSDIVFAFWNGTSTGTKDSIDKAERLGVPIDVILFFEDDENFKKEIKDGLLTFEDLVLLSNSDIQRVLREIDSNVLAKSLVGATNHIKDHVFKNISKKAVEILKEDIRFYGMSD